MDVRLYPFGNAEESEGKEEGRWKFQCQHGPKECVGNLLEVQRRVDFAEGKNDEDKFSFT